MGKKLDLTGQRFGRLIVIEPAPHIAGRTAWLCKCDCGNMTTTTTKRLRNGTTQSCGCLKKERIIATHRINEVGNQYGKLTVIAYAFTRNNDVWWHCKCECGKATDVMGYALRSGHTRSCGCLRKQSYGAFLIEQFLIKHEIKHEKEYTFSNFYHTKNNCLYRFDFAIFNSCGDLVSLIEFDGKQHFLEGESPRYTKELILQTQERDRIKDQYCLEHNIPLLRIKYDQEKKIDSILRTWFKVGE